MNIVKIYVAMKIYIQKVYAKMCAKNEQILSNFPQLHSLIQLFKF